MRFIRSFVFFDLDGTLLNSQSKISKDVLGAIEKLKEKGNIPVLATGRPFNQISHVIHESKIDSYILMNGQYINFEGTVIKNNVIPMDTISAFHSQLSERKLPIALYNNEMYVLSEKNDSVINTFEMFNIPDTIVDAKFYEKNEVLMMIAFTDNLDHDKKLRETFPELNFFRTSPYSIDVISRYSSKAVAITEFLKYVGAGEIKTYAFGDGLNDLAMLEEVNYGIAMGNAVDELKNVADLVVASNDEGGIIEGLKYYHLI